MAARIGNPRGLAAALLVIGALGASTSSADEAPPSRLEGAALVELARGLAAGPALRVRHQMWIDQPVPFATTRPCCIRTERADASRRLDRQWPERFARAMSLDSIGSLPLAERLCPCASHATRRDRVTIESGKGAGAARAIVDLGQGTLSLMSRDACSRRLHLGARAAELLRLLRAALPDDPSLATATPCDAAVPDTCADRADDDPDRAEQADVDELPEVLVKVEPNYPSLAREAGRSGEVMIHALLSREGAVLATAVMHSIPLLDEAAVMAVEHWKFRPARSRGRPVAVWVAVPVRFALD